jgi:protein-disulfide isomerase
MSSLPRISRRATLGAAVAGIGATGALAGHWLALTPRALAAPAEITDAFLFADPESPVLGNPNGSLPIAEFFDYRCPFCRRMHPLIQRLLAEEHDIRFVAKEWPLLGGASIPAAKLALAAKWQGKFAAVNDALFNVAGLDVQKMRAAATSAGLDLERLDRDLSARDADLEGMLGDVALQAASLGLQGTPGFVIGRYLVPGAVSERDLRELVAKARAGLHPRKEG